MKKMEHVVIGERTLRFHSGRIEGGLRWLCPGPQFAKASSVADIGFRSNRVRLVASITIGGAWLLSGTGRQQQGRVRETVVDTGGAYHPKLGFFASGKRVIVYRRPAAVDPATGLTVAGVGALKIAVER